MVSKEQELTFENISYFFSIAEEMVKIIADNEEDQDIELLLERVKIISFFIENAVQSVELILDSYTNVVKSAAIEKNKNNIQNELVNLILQLEDVKNKLLSQIK